MQKRKCFLLFSLLIILALSICLMMTACGESGNNDNSSNHDGVTDTEKPGDGNTDYDNEVTPTEGLEYELSSDGTYYIVTDIGDATATKLVIGETYNGLPVRSIGDLAFHECDSLTSVVMGDSITSIGERAFSGCDSLTSVSIGDSVKSIGNEAFRDCSSLTSIKISDNVTSIGGFAFSGCNKLANVTIPDSVRSIGKYAFLSCDSLTSVVIGDSVRSIGESAFSYCSSLTSVVIGNGVTSIGTYAFWDCYSLKEVYYKGIASEWAEVETSKGNSELTDAILYYYSETQPTTTGNYWHYVDGVVTKW